MTDKHDESMDVSAPVEIETKSKDAADAAQSAPEITDVGGEVSGSFHSPVWIRFRLDAVSKR